MTSNNYKKYIILNTLNTFQENTFLSIGKKRNFFSHTKKIVFNLLSTVRTHK